MGSNLGSDDVVDHFTLFGDELDLLRNKSCATRLGFAAQLKFVLWRGRFPRALHELPEDAVAHLARQAGGPQAISRRSISLVAAPDATAARSAHTRACEVTEIVRSAL